MGRPKGSKNKPKLPMANPAPLPPAETVEDETPRGGSKCGWCSTGQHDQCRPKLTSQPKWTCSCFENDHTTAKTKAKARRKV